MGLVQKFANLKGRRTKSLDSHSSGSGRSSFSDSPSSSSRHADVEREMTEIETVSPGRELKSSGSRRNSGSLSRLGSSKAKLSPSRRRTGRSDNSGGSPDSVLDVGKGKVKRGHSSEHAELAWAFKVIDENGDGRISAGELRAVLTRLGFQSSDEEFKQMMEAVDNNGDGQIDMEEFIHHNTMPMGVAESSLQRSAELRAAFHVFDLDKNDFISVEELHQVFKSLGEQTTMEECDRMIRAVDSDGDGQVDFAEFERMMSGVVAY